MQIRRVRVVVHYRFVIMRMRVRLGESTFKIADVPHNVKVTIGAVTYQQAPVVALKGVLHEADLAIDVARREGDDRFLVR